jgi:hypothetical protein
MPGMSGLAAGFPLALMLSAARLLCSPANSSEEGGLEEFVEFRFDSENAPIELVILLGRHFRMPSTGGFDPLRSRNSQTIPKQFDRQKKMGVKCGQLAAQPFSR